MSGLLKDGKKGAALIILRKMRDGSEESGKAETNEAGDPMDNSRGMISASEEMMEAMEARNPEAFMSALRSFIEMDRLEGPEQEEEQTES